MLVVEGKIKTKKNSHRGLVSSVAVVTPLQGLFELVDPESLPLTAGVGSAVALPFVVTGLPPDEPFVVALPFGIGAERSDATSATTDAVVSVDEESGVKGAIWR
jgi:hypothetical protein